MRCWLYLMVLISAFIGAAFSFHAEAASPGSVSVPEAALAKFMVAHSLGSSLSAERHASRPASSRSASIERPQALDGTQYSVVAPIFTGADGNLSYIRLFNGQGLLSTTKAASTFAISVIGSPSGNVYGKANIQVPAFASPQYSFTNILSQAQAPALSNGDTSYALYIQNPDFTGYQHVIYNNSNGDFENVTTCNQGYLNYGGDQLQVLMNVHTSALAAYPAQIFLQNYQNAAVTYRVTVVDSGTGNVIGTVDLNTAANASYMLPETFFEQQLHWSPTSSQPHANLLIQVLTSASTLPSANVDVGQFITNTRTTAYVNMSIGCLNGTGGGNTQGSEVWVGTFTGNAVDVCSFHGTDYTENGRFTITVPAPGLVALLKSVSSGTGGGGGSGGVTPVGAGGGGILNPSPTVQLLDGTISNVETPVYSGSPTGCTLVGPTSSGSLPLLIPGSGIVAYTTTYNALYLNTSSVLIPGIAQTATSSRRLNDTGIELQPASLLNITASQITGNWIAGTSNGVGVITAIGGSFTMTKQ